MPEWILPPFRHGISRSKTADQRREKQNWRFDELRARVVRTNRIQL